MQNMVHSSGGSSSGTISLKQVLNRYCNIGFGILKAISWNVTWGGLQQKL